MFKKQDGLIKALEERMEELQALQSEYDKLNRKLDPLAKSERLEELLMKVQLVLSHLIKVERNLLEDREDNSSFMFRSDIDESLKRVRETIKSYQGMAFAMSEVLRSIRIKIENTYKLQELSIQK